MKDLIITFLRLNILINIYKLFSRFIKHRDEMGRWEKAAKYRMKRENTGRVRWLMSVIPALWEAKAVDHEVKRSRPSWPTW